jgi:hypothetical protein
VAAVGCCLFALAVASQAEGQVPGHIPEFEDWFRVFDEPAESERLSDKPPASSEPLVVDLASHVPIPESERPAQRKLDLPETVAPSDLGPTRSELQELSHWVRWFALKNLPPNIEDNRKWGKQRKVYDGVAWKWDGLRLDTKRRWKLVNHGTWSRYFIEFIDPAKRLQIQVLSLQPHSSGKSFSTRIKIVAPLKVFARVSQFQRDVQWISVSVQADATVAMEAEFEIGIRINPLVFPPDVEFDPRATQADVRLVEMEVHRISQIRGDLAEWLGQGIRTILDRKLIDYNDKLVEKINASLAKQKDHLRLSAQDWLSSAFNKQ